MEETTWNKLHLWNLENIYISQHLIGRDMSCQPHYTLRSLFK